MAKLPIQSKNKVTEGWNQFWAFLEMASDCIWNCQDRWHSGNLEEDKGPCIANSVNDFS
jgi:hypothetical protein